MNNASVQEEEKKNADFERMPTTKLTSPSQDRAEAAASVGLSELSKQLRILQATNEAQSLEINRLERQLRILGELQGIAVADIRKALEEACAQEAFGELQHRVAKLRAELEAATLAKQKEKSIQTAAPHIANLELRIGELEELEERHRHEVRHLYDQLGHERACATCLGAENDQHKQDIARLEAEVASANQVVSSLRIELLRQKSGERRNSEEISKTTSAHRNTNDVELDVDPTHQDLYSKSNTGEATDADTVQKKLKEELERLSKESHCKEIELRDARTRYEIEKDKKNLVLRQLQDADAENLLRMAQFKARFQVQDERIDDMEQQLRSLYAAFGLIQEEQNDADLKFTALEINLNDADGELARHLENVQRGENVPDRINSQQLEHRPERLNSHAPAVRDGVPRMIETPVIHTSSSISREQQQASRSPPISNPTATGNLLDMSPRTPGTWELLFPEARKSHNQLNGRGTTIIMQGFLLVKSRSVVRKWKTKFCKLYRRKTYYQWDMEGGKSFTLGIGISKLEFNPNHPLSFTVQCNPYDTEAPVINAAASTEEDYHKWFDALLMATDLEMHSRGQCCPGLAGTSFPSHAADEQEEANLMEALRLSQIIT